MTTSTLQESPALKRRLHQMLADLQALQAQMPGHGLAALPRLDQLAGLRRTTMLVADAEVLAQLLASWADDGAEGWIEATGAVHELDRGSSLVPPDGRVLSADLAKGNGDGLRVRAAPGGNWTATTLQVAQTPEPQDLPVVIHEVRHASVRSATERLVYRVVSSLDDAGNLQVVDAWFTGFATHTGR
jgi:hypothetical protein